MKRFPMMILAAAAMLTAAAETPVLTFDGSWRGVAGPGETTKQNNAVTVARSPRAAKPFIAVSEQKPLASGFYIFSGKARPLGKNASGTASVVARTASGGWIQEWRTAKFTANADGKAQSFAIRFFAPESTAKIEVQLNAEAGKIEFSDLEVRGCDWKSGRAADAPELEFWINMDYFDNVVYVKNLHLENYDEPAIVDYFKLCREMGVTGVQWRVSVLGHMAYPTRAGTMFPGKADRNLLDPNQRRVAETLQKIDPLKIAVREARKNGIQIYIWMTLSDEASKHDKIPDHCCSEFQLAHPETMLLDRSGKPLKGTMCYNEPAAVEYRLAIVKELLSYGADGLYLCTRSHSFMFGSDKGDDYGFNPSVVAEYKRLYGVDILTQEFDVEKWRAIRAAAFDRLIEEIARLTHAAGQKVRLGTCFNGLATNRFGGNWGKMPVDWRRYLREGWVDSIVSGQNRVEPFFAGNEINVFRQAARPDQKLYFWAQMVDYGSGVFSLERLLRQAEFFAFYGANGGIYHESVNFEERDAKQKYFAPIADFYRSVNKK